MTKPGSVVTVEASEVGPRLAELLGAVEREGVTVRVQRSGVTVAVLQRPTAAGDPLATHPAVRALHVAEDAFAPVDEQDWPADCR